MVMFHFCPEDHWYFTKGPEHFKHIQDHFEIVGTVRKEKEDLEWILDNESKDFDPQKLQQHEMMLDHKKQTLEILLSQHDRITGMKGIDE
jgi:hypothetical protein